MAYCGIDIFAGAGGLSEGFTRAGFNIIGTVEKESWACETLRTRHIFHQLRNIGQLDYYWNYCRNSLTRFDIAANREKIYKRMPGLKREIDNTIWQAEFGNPLEGKNASSTRSIIKLIEQSARFHRADVNFILGGPPCQAYSVVGRSRMGDAVRNDRRNYLFRHYYEIVKHFQPDFFLFENVPGIITANDGHIFEIIQEDFDNLGYEFLTGRHKNINQNIQLASNFGVAQARKRFIFIGIRQGVKLEYPNFPKQSLNGQLSTRNAIGDLPVLQPEQGHDHGLEPYPDTNQLSDYQEHMRSYSEGIMNHRARPVNRWYDKKIYALAIKKAEQGQILHYSELPAELKTHKNEHNFEDRFKVHWWNRAPHTIVAHIAKDGHYNIHPDFAQRRSLTVREAARIQSFPDNFKFEGSRTAQFVQVGNAVPPLMAQAFAQGIKIQLEKSSGLGKDC